ncbi:hypothetical protein BDV28DRAFT_83249 [Aspergillus coremiiformis]|uniref:Integral membrane protein n=1 Tax=Aspergillus coremiiformis TaxID=138285 RepID=A0A5N6ZKJ7_9EURO|nr:hypothetical protein BDV28DRAFT_83249 [Aspergillus coremiiformis]
MARWPFPWISNVQSPSWLFHLFIFTLVFSLFVRADDDTSLLPSAASGSFPSCALSCPILQQAQSACIPPSAPPNGRPTYVSCFCQSALITQLHNTPDGTCTDTCTSAADRSILKTWYNDFCSSGGDNKGASPSDAAAATSTAKSQNTYPPPKSWWSSHFQWVIMIIILIVGFSALTVLGVWLKRRHDAKYPNLYHAGRGSNSGLLFNRGQNASPGPKQPGQFMPAPSPVSHSDYTNTDSLASSSRTEVAAPRRTTSRLQKTPQPAEEDDVEIREVPR